MRLHRLLLAASLAASPLLAQDGSATIDPGMSRADVVQRLGKPLNERSTGAFTYLFYRNGCEKSCGMNDLVVLENGKVVDAVFRNGVRSYSGASTSPVSVAPARGTKAGARGSASAAAAVRRAGRGGIIIGEPANTDSTAAPRRAVTSVAPPVPLPEGRPVGAPEAAAGIAPVLGTRVNPADSVRALTPNRPTPIPGTRLNPTDSARAEAIRRQQGDTTRKP